MLAGKMNEIKRSVRRLYTRLFVLTAAVVFGAIAIAQAQKGKPDAPETPAALEITTKPLAIDEESQSAGYDEVVVPVNADVSINESSQIQWQGDVSEFDETPSDLAEDTTTWSATEQTANQFEADVSYAESPLDESQTPTTLPNESYDPGVDQDLDPYPAPTDELVEADPVTYEGTDAGLDSPSLPPADVERGSFDDVNAGLPEEDFTTVEPAVELPVSADADPGFDPNPLPAAVETDQFDDYPADGDLYPTDDIAPLEDDLPPQQSAADAASERQAEPRQLEAYPTASAPRFAVANRRASTGRPGPRNLEGPQTPTFTVEKRVPTEIQVGKSTKFEIRVRNIGRVAADNVVIRDEVPMGTDYVGSNPRATQEPDGAVYWQVGTIPPGEEVVVSMDLMPVEEGQVGSVATVSFEASATARSRATKPELVIEQTGPRKVLLGETVRFSIKLSNPGSGAATQVFIEEDVPVGLSHSSGSKLEYEVGTILPGQTRHLELTLKAAQAGVVVNSLTARGAGNLVATDEVEVNIVAPKLQVSLDGPSRRFLDRQATFSVSVANPGTAPAHDVEIVAKLPNGLKFVSTNNSGYYDQSRHAVIWSLEQLPAGEMGKAQFTAKPVEIGQYQIRTSSKARSGLESNDEHALLVEGIAALNFSLADQVDPLEVGGRTTYEIKVVNQGSKAATNVRFAAHVPEGLTMLTAEGPSREQIDGRRVIFEPIDRLGPQAEASYRVVVQAVTAGDHRFRVNLSSDEMSTPVIKEESTRVYAD